MRKFWRSYYQLLVSFCLCKTHSANTYFYRKAAFQVVFRQEQLTSMQSATWLEEAILAQDISNSRGASYAFQSCNNRSKLNKLKALADTDTTQVSRAKRPMRLF